jgi:hypothetical protein
MRSQLLFLLFEATGLPLKKSAGDWGVLVYAANQLDQDLESRSLLSSKALDIQEFLGIAYEGT